MSKMLSELLLAVVTAAIPVLSAYLIKLINELKDKAAAQTDSIKLQDYFAEIASAITVAVSTTSQTYVDALKKSGEFTKEAQMEAAQKALTICVASLSPAATKFIESVYGDVKEYLMARIEAEVRNQKTKSLPAQ